MDGSPTIELRWFYRGTIPDEISEWFDRLDDNVSPSTHRRSDLYLDSNAHDVGVKLSRGNLEVKYRQPQLHSIDLDGFGTAHIESWLKWFCDYGANGSPAVDSSQGWICVDKVRSQRYYAIPLRGRSANEWHEPLRLTSIAAPRPHSIAIEITQLQLLERSWWTIACEYLGNNIRIEERFAPLVRTLFIHYPRSILPPVLSGGYPQWLANVDRNLRISTE